MVASSSSRFLETEFEDASLRLDFSRQRLLLYELEQQRPKCHEEWTCCCWCCLRVCRSSSKDKSLDEKSVANFYVLLYCLFPALAVGDFVLARLAQSAGWYSRGVGDIICSWNSSACAVWIALMLGGVGVACVALSGAIYACFAKRRRRTSDAKRNSLPVKRKQTVPIIMITQYDEQSV